MNKESEMRPNWLKQRLSADMSTVWKLMSELKLNTVCHSASCPNIGECFGNRTATFLISGGICTRNCRFCNIPKGKPPEIDPEEPGRIADAVKQLRLKHAVITSVTRDDLLDGGAGQFAACINEIRVVSPGTTIEVLVPDFQGDFTALNTVLEVRPEIFNHNIETVQRLYSIVRPGADYKRSLGLLHKAALTDTCMIKSGVMLGLGEKEQEVIDLFNDLIKARVKIITLGQYLRPSSAHLPIVEYICPEKFQWYERVAYEIGFVQVAAGPFVRSSYHAAELFDRR